VSAAEDHVNAAADRMSRASVSAARDRVSPPVDPSRLVDKRRIRSRALILMSVALVFYFGFIALSIYRSHH
jgi:hypothetical protein